MEQLKNASNPPVKENVAQTCEKCFQFFDHDIRKNLLLPIGFVDPKTNTFTSTLNWCLYCCIALEKTNKNKHK